MRERPPSPPAPPVLTALMLELLTWVSARPRTYGETMEAWRSSCPRMPVWEDATMEGLVEVVAGDGVGMHRCAVRVTPLGNAALAPRAAGEP
jgi:hypothetical protein